MDNTSAYHFSVEQLTYRSREEINQEKWDKFIDLSPTAWLYHTYDMQDAIATWPGKSDLSFALVDENDSGEILAIIPLHRINRPFARILPNCSLESMGGIAFSSDLSKKQKERVSQIALEKIRELAKEQNAEEIRFFLSPLTPFLRPGSQIHVNPLIEWGFENTPSQTYIIDLQKSKDEIWNNFEGYCRTHIRKAEKTGFTVRRAMGEEVLNIYYDLHCRTYTRTNVQPHPFAYFELIWKKFITTGRAVCFFAEKDDVVVAADNEAVFKEAMSGWTAAGEGKSTSGVNNLLHWHAIQWALENNLILYESGEGFPGETSGKRKGLTDFKKSFGGVLYPIYRGRILQKPFLYYLRKLGQSIRK